MINISPVVSLRNLNRFTMRSCEGYMNSYVKFIGIREIEVANQSFAVDIFGTKKKILPFFNDVSHVIV